MKRRLGVRRGDHRSRGFERADCAGGKIVAHTLDEQFPQDRLLPFPEGYCAVPVGEQLASGVGGLVESGHPNGFFRVQLEKAALWDAAEPVGDLPRDAPHLGQKFILGIEPTGVNTKGDRQFVAGPVMGVELGITLDQAWGEGGACSGQLGADSEEARALRRSAARRRVDSGH
jgi:hypothetical protein